MSSPLHAQAQAARIIRDRQHFVSIVELALREIRAKDHLLGQIAPALSVAAFAEIYTAHEKQDARLQDAFTEIFAITEPPAEPSPKNQTTTPTKES